MNPMATSKADILKTSRELIQQNGFKDKAFFAKGMDHILSLIHI